VRIASFVAQEPEVVPSFRVLDVALHRVVNQREGAIEIADFIQGATDQERVIRVLERAFGKPAAQFTRGVGFTFTEQCVELEQQRIDDFVVRFRQIQRLIAE
jgi:hypothetical protein